MKRDAIMTNFEYIENLKKSKCSKCANYRYCRKVCEVNFQGCEDYNNRTEKDKTKV